MVEQKKKLEFFFERNGVYLMIYDRDEVGALRYKIRVKVGGADLHSVKVHGALENAFRDLELQRGVPPVFHYVINQLGSKNFPYLEGNYPRKR